MVVGSNSFTVIKFLDIRLVLSKKLVDEQAILERNSLIMV